MTLKDKFMLNEFMMRRCSKKSCETCPFNNRGSCGMLDLINSLFKDELTKDERKDTNNDTI